MASGTVGKTRSQAQEVKKGMRSVLFVCSANICRSPMAMGLLRAKVMEEEGAWQIESAGVWAIPGNPAAINTQLLLQKRGIHLRDHISRQITEDMVGASNLVLVMEGNHKEALRVAFPEYASRIYLLSEMVGAQYDIEDPIGHSIEFYKIMENEIQRILIEGYDKIIQLAEAGTEN